MVWIAGSLVLLLSLMGAAFYIIRGSTDGGFYDEDYDEEYDEDYE